ncbi:MAG TPA: ComEC/Rec2 family competence protein [Chitinophagaceae bacterium]
MQPAGVAIWKRVPFLRVLIPFAAGIIVEYHTACGTLWAFYIGLTGLILLSAMVPFSLTRRYVHRWVPGVALHLLFFSLGLGVTTFRNLENKASWLGKCYTEDSPLLVTILEPLTEKTKTHKTVAEVEAVLKQDRLIPVQGKLLIYFRKDSELPSLRDGSRLIIFRRLQPIRNSGNPGAFDYKSYCAFQGIHHQVFLTSRDFRLLPGEKPGFFHRYMVNTRLQVLACLEKYISNKDCRAVAEALLIGYREHLDPELVQSYSATGVVHIIAISGLHLGMIYAVLTWVFPLFRLHRNRIVKPLVILLVLWFFTFIAGAVPSILRSAVMFSCIIIGETFSRKASIYNTLAVSAVILLLYNPFYLWDAGFQLSYTAVFSIVVFARYVKGLLQFENKLLGLTWRMLSVTLSAQVFTLPVVLYHFHQFPNLFLLTNMVVVPLSAVILFSEILLLVFSPVPQLAEHWGSMVEWMLSAMNGFIERTARIPFAVTKEIDVSFTATILLLSALAAGSWWLFRRERWSLYSAGVAVCLFSAAVSLHSIRLRQQRKIIVYNIPGHTAIDIVDAGNYLFYGDTSALNDRFIRDFHLIPSRIANHISPGNLQQVSIKKGSISSGNRKIFIVDQEIYANGAQKKQKADAVIISGNPRLYMDALARNFDCGIVVFDASNPPWKIRLWKKDCDSLHLRHYSVPEQGAFLMDL